jgi:hypothetical protein
MSKRRHVPEPLELEHRHEHTVLARGHSHSPLSGVANAISALDLVYFRSDLISRILAGLTGRQESPWLVIVVRFSDDPVAPRVFRKADPLAAYKRVFTGEGKGELNVVDYFLDMSHGLLDLSNSKVVGPFRLSRPRADYVFNVDPQPDGKLNRDGVLALAKATAAARGIDPSRYAGIVVCGTPLLDLCGWTGGMAALCDDDSLEPSLLGQEMGHGYGSDHSGRHGSTDEYADPWDTMSTELAHSASHDEFGSVGPGLNAWNMRLRGWLDEDRVVTVQPGSQTIVDLKPLHDRPWGTIAIDVFGFLIEFRARERWDAGIPRPCVLVHRVEGNRSYLMAGEAGNFDLVKGDRFEWGSSRGTHIVVTVLDIETARRTARVSVKATFQKPPQYVPNEYLGGVEVDGGGFRIGPHGVVPVPPRDPVLRLRGLIDQYATALQVSERYGRPSLQLESLGDIAEEIGRLARAVEITSFHPDKSFSAELGRASDPARHGHSGRTLKSAPKPKAVAGNTKRTKRASKATGGRTLSEHGDKRR